MHFWRLIFPLSYERKTRIYRLYQIFPRNSNESKVKVGLMNQNHISVAAVINVNEEDRCPST